ncbi:hypothetical protein SPRG_03787 [Saprolegnia parasitica CBS 223.65]|uniref:VASt domain-containing protein n=1 Tax=Saprolegnia parasitica (strain CBS 223.65) TaxID=695850 RepID=A0A067CYI6_SAPPC|nr:hypothetical protein SPRG_03787 [Saprolegnia parasitica CBS 223.65]KDO31867.1 hypothetical protein SPRG_03787 [Saprolegnia parasitica CBS 223.65]|eukprot:XP_012197745.1 hypothetical protein SPRG_03787 [Saprolegnia parasitica CBS 223.65]
MDRSANIIVHLSRDAKHTVVLPSVATSKSVASVLHEALYQYARINHDTPALAVSGLYDMYSGAMLDLSASLHSVATFHAATKCMRLGAAPLRTNNMSDNNSTKCRRSDSPFESFVKSIFSLSDDTPRPAQLPPQTIAAPSLIECIAQLRAASIEELCTECRVAPEAAMHLVRQLQRFTSGARAFGPPDEPPNASSASSTASEDDPQDEDDDDDDTFLGEAPVLLRYAHDSPAFRREVAAIDAAWPRVMTDFNRVVAAAKAVLASSKCHLATLQDLYTELTAPIDETPCLRHLAGSAKRAWTPLTERCDRSMGALRAFASNLASEFVAPLETLLTHDLGRDAVASRQRLNAAFYAYWAMAHEVTSDPIGDDARLEAVRRVFESARLSMVRHVNDTFLHALRLVERTGCAFAHANAVVGQRSQLEAHCEALQACVPIDVWDGAPGGYLFHVDAATSARTRRWFYLEEHSSMLWSLQADRRTPEGIADLSQGSVATDDSMRYGLCLTLASSQRVLLQADTARLHHLWLEALTAKKKHASNQDDDDQENDDNDTSDSDEVAICRTLDEKMLSPIAFLCAPAAAFAVMARGTLPISVHTYWERFVADDQFTRSFLMQRGATDVALSTWAVRTDGAYGRSRRIQLPVETALSTGSTRVHASEVYQRRSRDHLEVLAKDESLDVPYGSYFVVESRTTIVKSMTTSCAVEMTMAVHFTKSTMFQRMIEKAVATETKESCEAMLAAMRAAIEASSL